MQNIFDKIRGGAEKATAEADRLKRLAIAQSELRSYQQQLAAATTALGQQALALFDAGKLTQPELLAQCQQQVLPVQQQIAAQQNLIERIREEKTAVPLGGAVFGHICPRCQIQLPPTAGFCPRCGTQAIDVAPPPLVSVTSCAKCGTSLAAGAQFCPVCGTRVAEAESSGAVCPSCNYRVRVGAAFCPNCGASLTSVVQPEEILTTPVEIPGATETEHAASAPVSDAAATSVCPTCNTSLPAEAVFCPNCGTPRGAPTPTTDELPQAQTVPAAVGEAICTNCGAALPAGVAFCPQCGSPIPGAQGS